MPQAFSTGAQSLRNQAVCRAQHVDLHLAVGLNVAHEMRNTGDECSDFTSVPLTATMTSPA